MSGCWTTWKTMLYELSSTQLIIWVLLPTNWQIFSNSKLLRCQLMNWKLHAWTSKSCHMPSLHRQRRHQAVANDGSKHKTPQALYPTTSERARDSVVQQEDRSAHRLFSKDFISKWWVSVVQANNNSCEHLYKNNCWCINKNDEQCLVAMLWWCGTNLWYKNKL